MPYYMGDARGDYYQGDFWSKLGKGIKKAVKFVAPIAAVALPFVGGATLVGRAVSTAGRIKKAGRALRGVQSAQQLPLPVMLPPTPVQAAAQPLSVPAFVGAGTTAATKSVARIRRAAYRRRRSTARRRTTARRRSTRRRPRRRS